MLNTNPTHRAQNDDDDEKKKKKPMSRFVPHTLICTKFIQFYRRRIIWNLLFFTRTRRHQTAVATYWMEIWRYLKRIKSNFTFRCDYALNTPSNMGFVAVSNARAACWRCWNLMINNFNFDRCSPSRALSIACSHSKCVWVCVCDGSTHVWVAILMRRRLSKWIQS